MEKPKPSKYYDIIYDEPYLEKKYKDYKSKVFHEWLTDTYDYLISNGCLLTINNDDWENKPEKIQKMLHYWFLEFCEGYDNNPNGDKSYEIKIRYWW